MMRRVEMVGFAAVVFGALLACKKGDGGIGGPAPISSSEPFVVVTAEELFTAYDANEVLADEKYKGKRIRVVGMVKSIDKDAFDNMVVYVEAGPKAFLGVSIKMLDTEKPKVAGLVKGHAASFECRGGGMVMKTPIAEGCTVLGNAAAPASSKK